MKSILIKNAQIFLDNGIKTGSVVICGEIIKSIHTDGLAAKEDNFDEVIDASGLYLMPGVIDDHVHFREPGLTSKADIYSESRAAAAGGVTSYMEMPNCNPQTTSFEALEEKMKIASQNSLVNYSFFIGATKQNTDLLPLLDESKPGSPEFACNIPGVKLFMGSSTGNMLVDGDSNLDDVFSKTPESHIIMVHCEDTGLINDSMRAIQETEGEDPDVRFHPDIRTREACIKSSAKACLLAKKHNRHLHIAHITTKEELDFLDQKMITGEACPAHLLFSREDYLTLGTRIKCNPAVKEKTDRNELRKAISDGRISLIGTDHAPHLLSDKEGGCKNAASGMPMIQFSLVSMLEIAKEMSISPEQIVKLMCHAPADLFRINRRGYIREGYYADLVLVSPDAPWALQKEDILSKCAWSPLEGKVFSHKIVRTFCNGKTVFQDGKIIDIRAAKAIEYRKQTL